MAGIHNVGAAFVPNGLSPSEFDGAYIYGDYVCGRLFILKKDSNGAYSSTPFFTNLGRGTPMYAYQATGLARRRPPRASRSTYRCYGRRPAQP